jgi:VanZ family protein
VTKHPQGGLSQRTHRLVLAVYTAIVTVTSLRPGGDVDIDPWDKAVHLLVYYIFAVLAYRALANKRYYPYICLGVVVYSGLLELAQSWVPDRTMSIYDLAANTLGVILGAAVATRRPSA